MIIKHEDYLSFEIPNRWMIEEDDETMSIFDINGYGSITLSFCSSAEADKPFGEQLSIMAKKIIDNNKMRIDRALILDETKKSKTVLYGSGTTSDDWFIKLWFVGKFPRIVVATYHSEKRTAEVKTADKIMDSFQFTV